MRTIALVGFFSVLLLGAGCEQRLAKLPGSFLVPTADGSLGDPKQNAEALLVQQGSQLSIQPFGVAAVTEGNSPINKTVVTVSVWSPQDKGEIQWTRTESHETAASLAAREAFQKKTTSTPIGTPSPKEPSPQFEAVQKKGTIVIQNLRDSQSNFLPAFWPEGKYEANNNGIIFLSRDVFTSLRASKKAPWHPGIFENPVRASLNLSDSLIAEIAGLKEKIQQIQGGDSLIADDDFSSYELLVKGKKQAVQVFTAHDAVAEYVILDNPHNPILLKTTLRPRGFILINLFTNASTLLKAFIGYSVTEITL